MSLAGLRRACERRLAALELPTPFDVEMFAAVLAKQRSRPIHLLPVKTTLGPCGLWAATDVADYVFFERDTTPLHRHHIILHELCHLICEHKAVGFDAGELSRLLAPSLRTQMIRTVMGRHEFSDDEEQEAELLLASLILERKLAAQTQVTRRSTDAEAAIVDGLRASLGAVHPTERS